MGSLKASSLPLSDILQGNFKPDYYLKHIQKDLRLAISMGDMANHPTPMAAAANEVLSLFSEMETAFSCWVSVNYRVVSWDDSCCDLVPDS